MGTAYGATPGDGNWDAKADITDNGIVNVLDAVLVGENWHKSNSPW